MLVRAMGALLLTLALVPPAIAASFDCAKARTPFAKAICTHPDLSKADETVAKAFETARGGLSAPARAEVSAAQDGWVKFANLACADNAKPATRPYDADGISCLANLFDTRTRQLQNSKMLGGLRIYYVDRYAALPDPDPGNDGVKVATKAVSTPRIDGTDREAAAFNRFIETGTGKDIDPGIADRPSPADGSEDDTNTLIVTAVDPARITMTLTTYMYGHGAAHGNYGITYIHYLRDKARRLVATDVFATPGWQHQLQTLALAAVKQTEGDALMLDDPSSINDSVIDPARWDFSSAGLILQFEPYEVAPYAAGAPAVTIPWSDLDALLAPGAQGLEG
ncbi:MAG: DUF3298 domain-containing protein [Devosia sp.]|nr:DUF3298 domain-containing protein [Devosia sp.]